ELVKVIEQELEKEASYNHIKNYYRSNLSSGLPSTYNTIFNAIDLVKKFDIEVDSAIEHHYDVLQIQLKDLLSEISTNEVQEIWKFKLILVKITEHVTISEVIKISTSTPLYHIGQIRTTNIYMPTIKDNVNKKHQFGTTMSIAKTSVQVAVAEDSSYNINEISNPEYYKPRGRPPKWLKPSNKENKENAKQYSNHEQQTCSYCSVKSHNI
ncbi:45062_t:CDS:2, partial [Gigaspora margarita]